MSDREQIFGNGKPWTDLAAIAQMLSRSTFDLENADAFLTAVRYRDRAFVAVAFRFRRANHSLGKKD